MFTNSPHFVQPCKFHLADSFKFVKLLKLLSKNAAQSHTENSHNCVLTCVSACNTEDIAYYASAFTQPTMHRGSNYQGH